MKRDTIVKGINIALISIASVAVLAFICFVIYIIGLFNSGMGGPEPVPLTELEEIWKKKIEKKYNCTVNYIGLDGSYQEDSVTYINIEHTNASPLEELTSDSIERITGELAISFLNETDPGRTQSHILLEYDNTSDPANKETNIPDVKQCYFDVAKRQVIPNIQRLIVFRFKYREIDYQGNELSLEHLGGYRSKAYYYADLERERGFEKINDNHFKGLDHCEEWETKHPQKIYMANGFMELTRNTVFHHDQEISAVLTYKVYPGDSTFTYRDVVRKLTMKPRSPKNGYKEDYSTAINRNYLSAEYLDYSIKKFGVTVKATADTTSVPWTIRYETSVDDLNYYSDVDYTYEDQ